MLSAKYLIPFILAAATPLSAQTAPKPDLTKDPTLYVVGYAHLDTEWRWEYPQVINEYIRRTMEDNFTLIDKYPHYIFNFSGANRYRFMKEYFPKDFAKVKVYVDSGRWFPAGSSMEEGDVNAPNAEAIIRQILYGNLWFKKEFGKASEEYMLPDCFGFPASLPTILAHAGVKGFSTQKLVWGSSADGGGPESIEDTPEGTPFNVGVWVGPDGESVLAGINPGSYSGGISSDLSKPLAPPKPSPEFAEIQDKIKALREKFNNPAQGSAPDPKDFQELASLQSRQQALEKIQSEADRNRFQSDWAARVENNGKQTGLFTDYHYYGTGDIGGAPREDSIKILEAIVTKSNANLPPEGTPGFGRGGGQHPDWPSVPVGEGPVHVISATADQMFKDIPASAIARLPRYTGEMELTNHSAGSLTSQAYQKRWLRKEELLADAAEKSSIAAAWLGARPYPLARLNDAWTLVMGGHFHDVAAGTATPKAYEFAWNDDVLALNQFAAVLKDATSAVASGLDTQAHGVPVVVFNQLNIPREEIVEAAVTFPAGAAPQAVRVYGPDGKEVPAQLSGEKVLFLAKAPSTGYAVYDVRPESSTGHIASNLHVSESSLENDFYIVKLDSNGDVSTILDKSLNKELLCAPARLAISYDNPKQWPAWNMDWDQEQAAPKAYVSGPAEIKIVEQGPARVALQVSRQTNGSKFVQTISLSAGEAGKRVEWRNVIDWNTKESNLKATFPLSASNSIATYNWDIGTIDRRTAEPKKFEVPSHQWVDLTDASGTFGATVLTDCKNASDKPTDNTIRLTLIRTPGIKGGYPDQATQDIGHHEFVYGLAGHAKNWRDAQTDWQGQSLNAPFLAFQTEKHNGALGREFSLLKINNPRIRVLAVKKAEETDELVVRMVELNGAPQADVRLSFAAPVLAAREINGQEQPLGPAIVSNGQLQTSFTAYQPRTFALKLAPAKSKLTETASTPVTLQYDTAAVDGKGNAYPSEMLPSSVVFDNVSFQLAAADKNAVTANGQTLQLPAGKYNRVYLLASAINGDQKADLSLGDKTVALNIEEWGGFIGQWDDRQWLAKDVDMPARGRRPAGKRHDDYAEMTGILPGYIKPADVAWFSDHHHNAAGENVPYAYSYIFSYALDLPPGAKTITLPKNTNVRIFAVSVANTNPELTPVQPLYDTLHRSEPTRFF
jgi:alpha-mannosidase